MSIAAPFPAAPTPHLVEISDDDDDGELENVEDDDSSEFESEEEESSESDDSEDDPTFDELSVQKRTSSRPKSRPSALKSGGATRKEKVSDFESGEVDDMDVPALNEIDRKSFECVEGLIRVGNLEKLKIDQCKVYLRKYGLRLTGNKETLIQRIKEHIRILSGGGEREHPASSFVINCKGDACMGDVVIFEQIVYESYDLASRRGPPLGTRVVAGHIVKESYGAAKQQHTFTIEVLWSRGEKPLPPLHPLLIKGRNLYKMKTLRQKWEDESLREKALRDKHSRGNAARSDRELRIQEKKKKLELRGKRLPRMHKPHKDQAQVRQSRPSPSQNGDKKDSLLGDGSSLTITQSHPAVERTEAVRNCLGKVEKGVVPQQNSRVETTEASRNGQGKVQKPIIAPQQKSRVERTEASRNGPGEVKKLIIPLHNSWIEHGNPVIKGIHSRSVGG